MQKNRLSTKRMVLLALLVALNVILGRLSIQVVPQIRVSVFGFLPIALGGMLLGPVWGALTGLLGDVVSFLLFNHAYGPFFPGYTVTALLSGLWYGYALHGRTITWLRAVIAIVPVIILGEMGLNSLWTYVLYGDTLWALLPARLVTNAIECPVKILLLLGMSKVLARFPQSYLKL